MGAKKCNGNEYLGRERERENVWLGVLSRSEWEGE